jgi:D-sedoheptulose 7-phosphate isomerase
MSESTPLRQAFLDGHRLLGQFLEDRANTDRLEHLAQIIAACYNQGGKVIIFGNGGSACDAAHFAEEMTGRYRKDRRALPAIAVTDAGHITCVANDYGYDSVFSRSVEAFAQSGDVVIGISTSGNSPNVLKGLQAARERQCVTVGLTGKDGGKLHGTCDFEWICPGATADRIQEIHMMLLHILIEGVERILFPENYR